MFSELLQILPMDIEVRLLNRDIYLAKLSCNGLALSLAALVFSWALEVVSRNGHRT